MEGYPGSSIWTLSVTTRVLVRGRPEASALEMEEGGPRQLGCHNKIPSTRVGCLNNRDLFLIVLEAGRLRARSSQLSFRSKPSSWLADGQRLTVSLCLHLAERKGERERARVFPLLKVVIIIINDNNDSPYKDPNPTMRVPPPDAIPLGVRASA